MVEVEVVTSFQTLVSVSQHMALVSEYIAIRLHLLYNLSMIYIYIYIYILAVDDNFVRGNVPLI